MRIAILSLTLVLAGCGTMQIGEGNFIRPDSKSGVAPAARLDFGTSASEDAIATPDGAQLRGITLHQPGTKAAVLYFGGNAFHIDPHGRALLPLLASCGLDVAVFDYRGYGRSSGVPDVATMSADALRIYDHVLAQHPAGVIVHGQSLGSFMAAHVARERAPRGVVLEATATTVQDWADANVPWYARPFIDIEVAPSLRGVDNVAAMGNYQGTTLVLAGERDKVTPLALGRKVYEAVPGTRKRWFVAEGAGHNDIISHPAVAPGYCAFLKDS